MKKTTLFLTCALPLALTACYSTNESENLRQQARRDYQALHGCQTQAVYQHKYFKECAVQTALEKEKKHKTVHLMEDLEGRSLVIPYASDNEQMLDPSMVYPVVDITMTEVVIKEGKLTQEDMLKDQQGKEENTESPLDKEMTAQTDEEKENVSENETQSESESSEITETVTDVEVSTDEEKEGTAQNETTPDLGSVEITETVTDVEVSTDEEKEGTAQNETTPDSENVEITETVTDVIVEVPTGEGEKEISDSTTQSDSGNSTAEAASGNETSLEEKVNSLLENGNSGKEQKEVLPTEEK